MNWQSIPSVTAPHYLDATLNQVQKCVNWYHEKTPDGFVLKSFSGYQLKGTVANNAACRGAKFDTASGYTFSVHGDTVYQINSDGTSAALTGSLLTSSAHCVFASGLDRVMLVDGTYGYIINPSAGTVTRITDSTFPSNPISCACYNGQFIVVKGLTDRWYMSAVDDGLTWTPAISARTIANGDQILHVEVVRDTVYFFGTYTIEQWYASTIDPYLQPVTGATLPVGIRDRQVVARVNDTLVFHGVSEKGRGAVWKIEGGQLSKITPPYLEDKLGDWIFGSVRSAGYTKEGHDFYEVYCDTVANFGAMVYDITSGTWLETDASRPLYTVVNGAQNGEPPLGFDKNNGKVYWIGGTAAAPYNQANGTDISRVLDFRLDGGMSRIFNSGIRFEFEAQHDSSSSYTLSATLRKSDDGGLTFGSPITLSKAVTSGTSAQQVILQSPPLGSAKAGRIYRLTMSPAARLILRRAEGLVRVGRF